MYNLCRFRGQKGNLGLTLQRNVKTMKRAAAAILLTVCILASVTLAQPPQQPPKPGPEHKWMDQFVGRWTGEADVKASPFGPAGKLTYTEDVEWAPGGFFQVMHWESKGPEGQAKGLTVMGYNAEEKVYFSFTFIGGNVSSGKGPVTVEGDTWTLTLNHPEFKRDGKLVKSRYVSTRLSPTSHSFKMERSTEGGPWSTFMEGKATKTP